jgi:hypothetical protein
MEQAVLENPLGVLESRMLAGMAGAISAWVRETEGLLDKESPMHDPSAARGKAVEAVTQGVVDDELAFLKDVALNPFEATHERYRRLGLTFYKGNRLRDALVDRGLLRVVEIRKQDGRVKLFEPTTAGRGFLKENSVTTTWRHGGVVHGYWVRYAADVLRGKGWKVEVEKPIGGGSTVDVAAEKDCIRMAVEVETGNSDVVHNVKRTLEAGFDRVVVLGMNGAVIDAIRRGPLALRIGKQIIVTCPNSFHKDA